jgi:hypothetical protein
LVNVSRSCDGGERRGNVPSSEGSASYLSVLSAQVTGLARSWVGGVAGWSLTATIWVKVSTSGSAVTAHNSILVDVVSEWAVGGNVWQSSDGDGELDTLSVGTGGLGDGSTDGVLGGLWDGRLVGGTDGVVVDDGSWGGSVDGGHRGKKGKSDLHLDD